MNVPFNSSWISRLKAAVCLWFVACVIAFIFFSRHWPMLQDAFLMHYVVFLTHHGLQPYRDIIEMNLPGSYMLDGFVMKFLGSGSVGWRIYDLLLVAISAVSIVFILRPAGRLPGILAAALFTLVHAQDGVMMAGERDFAASAFLLAATAFLFETTRSPEVSWRALARLFAFGLLTGSSLIIKPTLLPLAVVLLFCLFFGRENRQRKRSFAFASIAGVLSPFAGTLGFLLYHHAGAAFVRELHGIIPYHASLGHRSIPYLFAHVLSPLLPIFLVWVVAAVLVRAELTWVNRNSERFALFLATLAGLISYILQHKGFPYQRYPFTAFLITLMALDFGRMVRLRGAVARAAGWGGIVIALILCTLFTLRSSHFDRFDEPRPLLADLRSLGAQQGQVQCMDTLGNCIGSLYTDGIVQSTGFIYDCYLLDGMSPVAQDLRRRFWLQMERNTPRLIVVTDSVCYEPGRSFDKYARWPEFQSYLGANFDLVKQSGVQAPVHYWSRPTIPFDYRIYLRKSE